MEWKRVRAFLFGRPLHTGEADQNRIGVVAAVPLLGLGALASAAYGPEAALTVLRALGGSGPRALRPLLPEVVERRWYHLLLHSHTAGLLKTLLLRRGGPQVVVINTPWYVARRARPVSASTRRRLRQT